MPAQPAHVQQGEAVSTGNAAYDKFFQQVIDARAEAKRAEKDAEEARAELAKALELDASTATLDEILEKMSERAKKLRDKGVLLHLKLTPEAELVSVVKKPMDPSGEGVLKAVEASAKKSLDLIKRMDKLTSRAAALEKQRGELVTRAPGELGPGSNDVVRELEASEAVLDDVASLGSAQAGVTSKFILALAAAVETGGAAGRGPSAVAKAPGKGGGGGGKPQGKAPGGSSGPTSPASVPAKKPKPKSDDFEP
jgi:DNA repair exonuclease SbcCD ATPase subunit